MPSIKSLVFSLIILISISLSCNKNEQPDKDAVKATLHDYTGLDGCSWVIKLENDEVLEPENLGDFNFELKEGKKIWIKYFPRPDLGSFCMVGLMVDIETIWDR